MKYFTFDFSVPCNNILIHNDKSKRLTIRWRSAKALSDTKYYSVLVFPRTENQNLNSRNHSTSFKFALIPCKLLIFYYIILCKFFFCAFFIQQLFRTNSPFLYFKEIGERFSDRKIQLSVSTTLVRSIEQRRQTQSNVLRQISIPELCPLAGH